MEKLAKIAGYVQNLTKKQLERYIIAALIFAAVAAGFVTYHIYSKSTELLFQIKKIEDLSNKAVKVISDHEKLQQEAQRLQEVLDLNKDFNIKSYFESFCKEQNLSPDPGWDTRIDDVNDRFDEISLSATLRGITTETLVKVLELLDKKEIVYIKELSLKNEANKRIIVDIVIATKTMKKGLDQRGI